MNSMVKAVHSGEISNERLDQSVLKILKIKGFTGPERCRARSTERSGDNCGQAARHCFRSAGGRSAITLVRDNGKVLPLKSKGTTKAGLPYMTREETHNESLLCSSQMMCVPSRAAPLDANFALAFRMHV